MYSALKQQGKKLYELAREGIEVPRQARGIHIFELSLERHQHLHDTQNIYLGLSVTCSKGTYVRVLAEDIAKALGTLGHLTALRRIQTGGFMVADAISLEQLERLSHVERLRLLLPIQACLPNDMMSIELDDKQVERICQGQRLRVFDDTASKPHITIATEVKLLNKAKNKAQTFIGLGLLEPTGRLQPKRIINL